MSSEILRRLNVFLNERIELIVTQVVVAGGALELQHNLIWPLNAVGPLSKETDRLLDRPWSRGPPRPHAWPTRTFAYQASVHRIGHSVGNASNDISRHFRVDKARLPALPKAAIVAMNGIDMSSHH